MSAAENTADLPLADEEARLRMGKRVRSALPFLVALLVTAAFVLPLYWMVIGSLKESVEFFQRPPTWYPHRPRFENYLDAITRIPFMSYLKNSLYYAVGSALGACLSSAIVAYGFAKLKWKGRDVAFSVVMLTMFLPYQVTMIPTFLVFRAAGLVDSLWPLILPAFFGNAFFIFLMRQFIRTLPDELLDAARMDGCSEFGVFLRVVIPLVRPALVVVFLNQFLNAWKDFLGPLIYITDDSKWPLSLALQQFQSAQDSEVNLILACATVFTIPLLVIFLFTQRYFIEGVTFSGLKG
ncbi:MAG: carbohydrate ABC transporter permease [Propionivibrio sp.]|jgi:multiple sugar transport system permease protein|uniref:carbohydrate ABC transporter permease n=1 Tax=Propionivibrio sp. TaxID=2212460 RepID=UPI001B4AC194|nr:carbohydrate ABC transporter permease [Propionivibrio sp.]MBP7201669.1 carbohydrate ABC transporter permease [Propionivibrio sp.]